MLVSRKTLDFEAFIRFVEKRVKEEINLDHQSRMAEFLKLNYQRLGRVYKTFKVNDAFAEILKSIEAPQHWVLITEAWCGDSAQSLPVLTKISEASMGKIHLDIVLRDENLDLMDKYLTNGTRSIPKLIAFDDAGNELFTWGPRPAAAQKLYELWKTSKAVDWDGFEMQLHKWYSTDKGMSIQSELLEKIQLSYLNKDFNFSKN